LRQPADCGIFGIQIFENMIQNDKPRVIVKAKNLQLIFDYCIESKTAFTVNPRLAGDEWEVEFKVTDVMGGVALGMFLRENRLEPVGIQVVRPQAAPAAAAKAKATKAKKQESPEITEPVFGSIPVENAHNEVLEEAAEMGEELETAARENTESAGFSPEMLFD
jgi:hypothetical protein